MKAGFGQQFNGWMQPFDDSLYGYSTYNQWSPKVQSPLSPKGFPWGLNTVNPHTLSSVVSTQPLGFANNNAMTMSHASLTPMAGPASMTGQAAAAAAAGAAPCPYASAGTSPYAGLYNRDQCSSSIASLRLKAKQHDSFMFGQYPSPSHPAQSSLSACQYASVGQAGM